MLQWVLSKVNKIGAMLLLSAALVAGPPGLHREGDFWVETTSGSESMPQLEQIRVVAEGNVSVRGGSGSDVSYVVTRRVRARNEAEARDAFQEAGVNLTRQGRAVRIVVNDATGPVDLQVTMPRTVAKVFLNLAVGNIDVSDISGGVSAQTSAGNIELKAVKGSADLSTDGGNLKLGDIGGSVRAISAGGEVTANSIGGDAQLETAGGDIIVQKIGGSARAVTAGGSIRIAQVGGAVAANTGGGTIDIGRAGGVVTIHNAGGGPIQVGSSGGARCENASGAIKVGSWNGMIHLSTASGSVIAQILGEKLLGDSYVSTASGDITVYIPSNVGVNIRAENEGASRTEAIVSDFQSVQVRLNGGTAVAVGPINGGGPVLRLEGTGGTIWIRKK